MRWLEVPVGGCVNALFLSRSYKAHVTAKFLKTHAHRARNTHTRISRAYPITLRESIYSHAVR